MNVMEMPGGVLSISGIIDLHPVFDFDTVGQKNCSTCSMKNIGGIASRMPISGRVT